MLNQNFSPTKGFKGFKERIEIKDAIQALAALACGKVPASRLTTSQALQPHCSLRIVAKLLSF